MPQWGLHYIRVIDSNEAIVASQPVINKLVKANQILNRNWSYKLLV